MPSERYIALAPNVYGTLSYQYIGTRWATAGNIVACSGCQPCREINRATSNGDNLTDPLLARWASCFLPDRARNETIKHDTVVAFDDDTASRCSRSNSYAKHPYASVTSYRARHHTVSTG